MAKSKDSSGLAIAAMLIFGGLSVAWDWSKANWPTLCAIGAFLMMVMFVRAYQRRTARQRWVATLKSKYGNDDIVNQILSRQFWSGQTSEMLRDSLGEPADCEQKVLKTKTKAIWKYHHKHSNQYGLRVFLENNVVTGWEQK